MSFLSEACSGLIAYQPTEYIYLVLYSCPAIRLIIVSELLDEAPNKEGEKHFVLQDIDMKVLRGQLVAIVGPVGCGKTTLLSAFLGQLIKLKGQVSVRGMLPAMSP